MAANSSTMRGRARSIFSRGQFVLCVNDQPEDVSYLGRNVAPDMDGLTRGKVYTVRWSGVARRQDGKAYQGVRVEEIVRDPGDVVPNVVDLPYLASRFRPIDESRIDILRALLVTPVIREEA